MGRWLGDAGHGGNDPGAMYKGRKECDDVLRLSKRVKELMEFNGEKFDLTRSSNSTLELSDRTNIENRGIYDYFVSFHRNACSPNKASGVETYSLAVTGKGNELAKRVQSNLNSIFKNRGVKTANFYVLRKTKCPAILIEIGFIDSDVDNKIFDSKFEDIAIAITKACLEQVGKTFKHPSNHTNKPSSNKKGFYRVIVGSYQDKNNAIEQQKKLKDKGFDSFLEYFEK